MNKYEYYIYGIVFILTVVVSLVCFAYLYYKTEYKKQIDIINRLSRQNRILSNTLQFYELLIVSDKINDYDDI